MIKHFERFLANFGHVSKNVNIEIGDRVILKGSYAGLDFNEFNNIPFRVLDIINNSKNLFHEKLYKVDIEVGFKIYNPIDFSSKSTKSFNIPIDNIKKVIKRKKNLSVDPLGEEDWDDEINERFFKKKKTNLEQWDEQRRILNDQIKKLEEYQRELKDELFDELPIEKKEEIKRKRDELQSKIKDVDPLGEEEWEPYGELQWFADEMEIGDQRRLDRLKGISKAVDYLKPFKTYENVENENELNIYELFYKKDGDLERTLDYLKYRLKGQNIKIYKPDDNGEYEFCSNLFVHDMFIGRANNDEMLFEIFELPVKNHRLYYPDEYIGLYDIIKIPKRTISEQDPLGEEDWGD